MKIRFKKLFTPLILASIVVMFCAPFAFAVESVMFQNLDHDSHWAGYASTGSGFGWYVSAGNNQFLTRALIYVGSSSTYTGNIGCIAFIYPHGGNENETSSTTYSITYDGYAWLEFAFSGALNLTSDHAWVIGTYNLDYLSHTIDYPTEFSVHSAIISYAFSASPKIIDSSTNWNGPMVKVYTDNDTVASTPTPFPSGTPNNSNVNVDELANDIADFLIPVIVMLVPAFLLWWLGGKGKWPILIGLAIGTGLGVYFDLVPMWIAFLVAVGLVGMAYSDVSSGGSYT